MGYRFFPSHRPLAARRALAGLLLSQCLWTPAASADSASSPPPEARDSTHDQAASTASRNPLGYAFYGAALIGGAIGAFYLLGRRKRSPSSYIDDVEAQQPVTDPDTGLYNRAGMLQITEGLFANEHIKSGVCVMLLSIDHFKTLYDAHGAETAEGAVQQVVDLVIANIRRGDHFGRWGNGEFLLLLSGATEEGALQLAHKIVKAVAQQPFTINGATVPVTVSIGLAPARPTETFGVTLKRADIAISRAKAEGHNSARIAED